MKILILTANLGDFDKVIESVPQKINGIDPSFHTVTDKEFPQITGLSSRLQYRIPKMFAWQMYPGYDMYLWYDASMSFQNQDSVRWFIEQLGSAEIAFFKHPWRATIKEEVDHIEEKLQEGNQYITSRYKNVCIKRCIN